MPRCVVADAFGPPDVYEFRECPSAPLRTEEVRVALKAAGISFVDVLTAAGGYQVKPPLPLCPGSEAAGIVIETGSLSSKFAVGDAVVASGWGGLFAEEAVLPERSIRRLPQGFDFAEAAEFPVSYATAWHALVDRAGVRAGETVLVLGAGGNGIRRAASGETSWCTCDRIGLKRGQARIGDNRGSRCNRYGGCGRLARPSARGQ